MGTTNTAMKGSLLIVLAMIFSQSCAKKYLVETGNIDHPVLSKAGTKKISDPEYGSDYHTYICQQINQISKDYADSEGCQNIVNNAGTGSSAEKERPTSNSNPGCKFPPCYGYAPSPIGYVPPYPYAG